MANLVMAWGCQPSKMVLVDTKMITDFFDTLRDRYCRKTLTVSFPQMFDSMLAISKDDEAWEFWKSNKIQKCKIFYEHNKVTNSEGYIFVNTHCKSSFSHLEGAERRAKLKECFIPVRMAVARRTAAEAAEDFERIGEEEMQREDASFIADL